MKVILTAFNGLMSCYFNIPELHPEIYLIMDTPYPKLMMSYDLSDDSLKMKRAIFELTSNKDDLGNNIYKMVNVL